MTATIINIVLEYMPVAVDLDPIPSLPILPPELPPDFSSRLSFRIPSRISS